jgi:hypothetical protein
MQRLRGQIKLIDEPPTPAWRQHVLKRQDECDNDAQVGLATQESNRGWCRSTPAQRATEAQALFVRHAEQRPTDTPWLPRVIGDMQCTATMRTACTAHLFGDILVHAKQHDPDPGIIQR